MGEPGVQEKFENFLPAEKKKRKYLDVNGIGLTNQPVKIAHLEVGEGE